MLFHAALCDCLDKPKPKRSDLERRTAELLEDILRNARSLWGEEDRITKATSALLAEWKEVRRSGGGKEPRKGPFHSLHQ